MKNILIFDNNSDYLLRLKKEAQKVRPEWNFIVAEDVHSVQKYLIEDKISVLVADLETLDFYKMDFIAWYMLKYSGLTKLIILLKPFQHGQRAILEKNQIYCVNKPISTNWLSYMIDDSIYQLELIEAQKKFIDLVKDKSSKIYKRPNIMFVDDDPQILAGLARSVDSNVKRNV